MLQYQLAAQCLNTDKSNKRALSPVVLIPGAGGNQLLVKLTRSYKPGSWLCGLQSWRWPGITVKEGAERPYGDDGLFRLWLDVPGILPPFTSCFAERMCLVFNPDTGICENAPGVESYVPYFGSVKGMTYLDPSFRKLSMYMAVLVQALEAQGYVDGKSLLGAPYDFRYAPGEYASPVAIAYLEDLKSLIEEAVVKNKGRPVVLLTHSLGCLWGLYFLNQQTVAWRRRYIGRFIPVSAPWGGTVQNLRTYASGYAEGASFINPLVLRAEQRSSETNLWLLPVPSVFGHEVLVSTPKNSYSAFDIPKFLEDIGYPEGVSLYSSRVLPLVSSLEAPRVPVTLVYSNGIDTPQKLVYGKDGFDKQPTVVNGDGDGTVNSSSLSAVIDRWSGVEGQEMDVTKLIGKTHSSILTDAGSVAVIVDLVLRSNGDRP